MDIIKNLLSTIDPELLATLQYIGIFAGIVLIIGFLGRITMGKRSSLNHSVSSAMGILCIYVLTIVMYTFNPYDLSQYLTPLPYVTFSEDHLFILSLDEIELYSVSHEILSMLILSFLVNLLDTWIPKGKTIWGWYGYRFLTILLSMVLHYGATWAFDTYLPGTLVLYAPIILLGVLGVMVFLGFLNIVLSLVLTVVNPIIGALYTFFFSNIFGKQITKAVVTTIILSAVVAALNYLGYTTIPIYGEALISSIPMIPTLLLLWYIVGHIL